VRFLEFGQTNKSEMVKQMLITHGNIQLTTSLLQAVAVALAILAAALGG
jgi:hypothetical protein